MNNLILIEGIPGAGKTTTSKFVQQELIKRGIDAVSYQEGDLHPADLSWQSILPIDEYHKLLTEFPNHFDVLEKYTLVEDKQAITAYNRLGINPKSDLYQKLWQNDIYIKNVDLDTFKQEHLKRWKRFSADADINKVYIFECALLQNHITELMLKYEVDGTVIIEYLQEFFDSIISLSPTIIYLAPVSVENAIMHVAAERTTEDPKRSHNWINRVVKEISESNYGIRNNIKNITGCINYFNHRQQIELELLRNVNIECHVITHNGEEWKHVKEQVRNYLPI